MRPALLRLLKRPSAVSFLDTLIAARLGIEQLDSKHECLRCQVRRARQNAIPYQRLSVPDVENGRPVRQLPNPQSKLHVHDLESPQNETPLTNAQAVRDPGTNSTAEGSTPTTSWTLIPEKLDYESDVGHLEDIGSRLVDDPARRNDFALWEELLRYRKRHYGEKGTLDIWEGLTVRLDGVNLPVDGERADLFWQSFVDIGLKRERFLDDVANYALQLWKRTGNRWGKFYEAVVGGFFERGLPRQAVHWHHKLQHPHLSSPDDITGVFDQALCCIPRSATKHFLSPMAEPLRSQHQGLRAFRHICRATSGHRIYAVVISTLMKHGRSSDALSMHQFLIKQEDHPRRFEDVQPLLEYAKHCESRATFQKLQEYVEHQFPQEPESATQEPTEKTTTGADVGGWLEEKPFKDEFGARLFATEALTFDMILGGLKIFGVSAIGPHTLREMAVRARGTHDIVNKIDELQRAGISIGNSVFSRVVRRLASEHREIMLHDLLHSDEHPDVLEDAGTQESLLVSYYLVRDWRQYNMTLAILSELSDEGPELFNVHFRKHIVAEEWSSASRVVDEMSLQGKTLSDHSIGFMVRHVLTPRKKGVAPVPKRRDRPVDEVAFVSRTLQRVVKSGGTVPPELWIEVLKRLGMSNRWDDVWNLCLWLAHHYSPTTESTTSRRLPSSSPDIGPDQEGMLLKRSDGMLRAIFNPQMQEAIVTWGFRMRPSSKPDTKTYNPFNVEGENLVPWVRGLVLLRELQQKGVRVQLRVIRRACRHRLAVLFGRRRHSSRRMSRLLRRENPYSAERVIGDMHRVWGPLLFRDREFHDLRGLVNPPSSKMSLRRTRRTLWREANLRGRAFLSSR